MFVKTFEEMLKDYALRIETTGEETLSSNLNWLPEVGWCTVHITPVIWTEDKKMDRVLRFAPVTGGPNWYCLESKLPANFEFNA